MFEQEKQALLLVGSNWINSIEHIGSTAIPNIHAKPIIDIMIGVNHLSDADEQLLIPIQSLGYEYLSKYESMFPERRFFQKYEKNQNTRTHHIHLVEVGSPFWNEHLLFRNYLINNPIVAKEYEALKLHLAPKFSDSNLYAGAKTEFIRQILINANKN